MPIKRAILEGFDVPDSNYETVMMLVEVPPQVNTGLHTHPGFDAAYLLKGSLTVITLGQPDRAITAGNRGTSRPASFMRSRPGMKP
jgi:quercetin dioxygenase-like cupin family protein